MMHGSEYPTEGGKSLKRHTRPVVTLAAALVAGGLGAFLVDRSEAPPSISTEDQGLAQEILRLRGENRSLEIELALAAQEQPYLFVDLPGQTITLKSHGVALREFQAKEVSVRRGSRVRFWRKMAQASDTAWEGGTLLPGKNKVRAVILSDSVEAPDPSGTIAFIPPTPEEATPGPPTFRIRFEGGLSLFVRSGRDGDSPESGTGQGPGSIPAAGQGQEGKPEAVGNPNFLRRLTLWFRLKPWRRDHFRVNAVLSPDEAGALYRAFSDGTPLLVAEPEAFSSARGMQYDGAR